MNLLMSADLQRILMLVIGTTVYNCCCCYRDRRGRHSDRDRRDRQSCRDRRSRQSYRDRRVRRSCRDLPCNVQQELWSYNCCCCYRDRSGLRPLPIAALGCVRLLPEARGHALLLPAHALLLPVVQS